MWERKERCRSVIDSLGLSVLCQSDLRVMRCVQVCVAVAIEEAWSEAPSCPSLHSQRLASADFQQGPIIWHMNAHMPNTQSVQLGAYYKTTNPRAAANLQKREKHAASLAGQGCTYPEVEMILSFSFLKSQESKLLISILLNV